MGPAVVATLIARGLSWKWLYVAAAAICLLLVAMAWRVRYPDTPRRTAERATLREMVRVLRDPLALGMSALVMLYVAVEVAVYVWMPTYLLGYGGSFAWLPAYALTLFFVLRAVGRFLGAWLLAHVPWTAALAIDDRPEGLPEGADLDAGRADVEGLGEGRDVAPLLAPAAVAAERQLARRQGQVRAAVTWPSPREL